MSSPYVNNYSGRIENELRGEGDARGLAIVVSLDAPGAHLDADNMEKAFRELKFAVITEMNISGDKLRALVAAVATAKLDDKCEVIAIYLAGHGGSVEDKPYVKIAENDKPTIDEIVSPLYPEKAPRLARIKRLFFFDICLGESRDAGVRGDPPARPYAIPARGNCLVAFSTSLHFVARGDKKKGGYWTRHLHELITQDKDIFEVLAITWENTVCDSAAEAKDTKQPKVQGPHLIACMGRLNLKRKFTISLVIFE